jgi:hypothetical protein
MTKLKELIKLIKESPFKPLVKKWYVGKIIHGSPYFNPMGFHPTIFSIRKLKLRDEKSYEKIIKDRPWLNNSERYSNLPMVRRTKNKIISFMGNNYYISWGSPISYVEVSLGWKDKYDTPRFEWGPSKMFYFFKWQVCVFYKPENITSGISKYWEMYLWWKYYSLQNLPIAKSTWGWVDGNTKESTWDNNNLKY